jgi:hypothetical protein
MGRRWLRAGPCNGHERDDMDHLGRCAHVLHRGRREARAEGKVIP